MLTNSCDGFLEFICLCVIEWETKKYMERQKKSEYNKLEIFIVYKERL